MLLISTVRWRIWLLWREQSTCHRGVRQPCRSVQNVTVRDRSGWKAQVIVGFASTLVFALLVFVNALPPVSFAEDGTYRVGDCFRCNPVSGTWQTHGGVTANCVWMVRTEENDVVDHGEFAPGERGRVVLQVGEYFTTVGCQPWVLVG